MKISVVIAAKNEEKNLRDCLKSVAFADEVVLVDDESDDATVKIASQYGARIFHRQLDGFASQKNFGIDKTTRDWVLVLDADERISPELAAEITDLKPSDHIVAYSMPFKNYLGSKWLRHGGLYPDKHNRLFNKTKAHYSQREIHEQLRINGQTAQLNGSIIHLTYKNYRDYLRKVKKYASLEANWVKRKPGRSLIIKTFFVRLIKEKGYLDGLAGLISAALLAYYQYIVRKKFQSS